MGIVRPKTYLNKASQKVIIWGPWPCLSIQDHFNKYKCGTKHVHIGPRTLPPFEPRYTQQGRVQLEKETLRLTRQP